MSKITDRIRNAAKAKNAAKKLKAKPRKPAAKKASKPKPKAKTSKKVTGKQRGNPKGVHLNPQPMPKATRMFTDIFLADLIREACAGTNTSHAELARRLEMSGPRIPEILRSENITEDLAARCFKALGVDLEIKLVKKGAK